MDDLIVVNVETHHFGRMSERPPLSTLTAQQLRTRALEYRAQAGMTSTVKIRDAMIRLAEGFETLAAERELIGKAG